MFGMGNLRRTDYCGNLRKEDIGREVTLMGWVAKERDHGSLTFIDIRDYTGITQVVIHEEDDFAKDAKSVRSEYVIAVRGVVEERESKNPNMETGDIEVSAREFRILASSKTPPIYVRDDDDAQESLRLKYRYLDLRKPYLQKNLRVRAKAMAAFRHFLDSHGFLEVETPILTKPTPEGARDYLVPSRVNPHMFYALPQSPQLMKQMLMIGGADRYYQLARCFRDEDLRANRQPEFTQVDIEMSFVDVEDVLSMNEELIKHVFKEVKDMDIETPIRRIRYEDAMEKYGSDKPDLRFGTEIENFDALADFMDFEVFTEAKQNGRIGGLIAKGAGSKYSRKGIDALEAHVKTYGAKGLIWVRCEEDGYKSSINKFMNEEAFNYLKERGLEVGDILFIVAGPYKKTQESLGALRVLLGKEMELYSPDALAMAWIVEFPLFEYDEEEGRYVAMHHPFTSPMIEDLEFLETEPEKVRAKAYDIVMNGDEMGGGSIRINTSDLQRRMFKALSLDDETVRRKFGFFVDAFQYGAPPHGGIAYGFDRFVMLLTGTDNIRDVLAFPKTQSATCPLTNAPSIVDEDQLQEAHIRLSDE